MGRAVVVVVDSMVTALADSFALTASLLPQLAKKSAAHATATNSPQNDAVVDFIS